VNTSIFDPIELIRLIVYFFRRLWKKFVKAWTNSSIGSFISRQYNRISGWVEYKVFRFFHKLIRWEGSTFSDSATCKYYRLHGHKRVMSLSRFRNKIVGAWTNSSIGGFISRQYNRISGWVEYKVFRFFNKLITFEGSTFSDSLMYKYYRLHGHKYVVALSRFWNKIVEAWTGSSIGGFITRKYNRFTRKLSNKVFHFFKAMIRWEAKPVEETFLYGYYNRYGNRARKSASRYWAKVVASQSGSVSASRAHLSYRLYHWMLGSIWDKYRFPILTILFAIIAGAIVVLLTNPFKTDLKSYQDSSAPETEEIEILFNNEKEAAEFFYGE